MAPPLNPAVVTAVLGPTNTGKTHYAVERMLGRASGVIGLPLRLLAREVYDKICAIKGERQCALITGEEKIVPKHARYYVCTVEAMPMEKRFAFLAVDEIQLMGNFERGHIFTDRLLHARGTEETLFLGAETARPLIQELLPKARYDYRERFSTLSYVGETKLTRLPKRSVIVAFSAAEVYAIAELIRRQRGGAAVVMGALSPRTRNAQADLYQSGEVDFLIATDAVGMGLNLDADHVAFASLRKYDGHRRRILTPMEAAQIAGRAGRFRNNGTFGTTGDCRPMDPEMIQKIENHNFEPMHRAEWRNSALNFSSLKTLDASLHAPTPNRRLRRARGITDELSLERMVAIPEVAAATTSPAEVKRLWDICQIPDFRNMTIDAHVRLLQDIYRLIVTHGGKLPDDYMQKQVNRVDETLGGVDILSSRLAHIRTWTYCANKVSWMHDSAHWIRQTRAVEDRLSDALHESLIERFVDKRTSALLKGIGTGAHMDATVKDNGEVWVDDHLIGHLKGLSFTIDESASELEAKALSAAAEKAVSPEIDRRLTSLCGGTHAIFTVSEAGKILWGGNVVGKIGSGGTVFNPDADVVGAELGNANLRNLAADRMREFLRSEVTSKLEPLHTLKALSEREDALPAAKGFAFVLLENYGSIDRSDHFAAIKALEQDARKQLRDAGVVFGQYNIFLRDMLKPKPSTLLGELVAFGAGGDKKPFVPFAGMTSLANEGEMASDKYSKSALSRAGYRACGPRIVRFDIVNRLAALIRQAQTEAGGREFQVMQEMLALMGCTMEEVEGVLRSLGYKSESKPPKEPAVTSEDPTAPAAANQAEAETRTVKSPAAKREEKDPTAPAASTAAEAEIRKIKSAKKQSAKLSVYHKREANAAGDMVDVPNIEFWSMPFRHNSKPNNRSQSQNKSQNRKQFKGKKPPRGPKKPSAEDKAKEQKRMEDSPFAALAALKNTIKDGK